jgi:transcriptional regulator with GAF, ATPase, and Fis domain
VKLIKKEDEYFIRDLKSTNGTFVDGEKISSGVEFEIGEGIPFAVGKTEVCIGEECLEDIESAQDSRELAKKASVNGKDEVKTRPFTFQKNMELMYNVCHVLMESLDMDDILQKILDQILDLFKRTDRGVIILIDHETKAISKEISRIKGGSKEAGKWYSLDVVEQVIENSKAIIISDVYLEDNDGLSGTLEIMKIGSVMCVPLKSKSQLWGVIYVDSVDKAYGFREEDRDLLTALSTPIAFAIENTHLYSSQEK